MVREGAMVSVMCSFACLTVLALLTDCTADGSVLPEPEKRFDGPLRKDQEVIQLLNTSALNTALAFEPYHDLATRNAAEPGVQQQQQQQHNILFSPWGLASALVLLLRVSGSDSRSQTLEALGLAANSTDQSVEATISALADLHQSLAVEEGGAGGGVQRAESEAGDDTGAGIGADVDNVAGGRTGTEDGVHVGGQLRVWSDLHIDGKPSLDYDRFLSRTQRAGPAFNISFETLMKEMQTSDKVQLSNYVYFKGRQPFERRHTVPRRFQLNATTSVEVSMMFGDDSAEVMMLYDTNCSATVVRMAQTERLASLFLLPKAELQPLEECLSDSRMSFWLSNLKPGRAEILLPKFKLRRSYSLQSALRSSGVSSVFSESADFSGISPNKTLRLVKAPHEVMVELEDTKSKDGGRPDIRLDFSVPPRITFNRPFMLIVYDSLTGLILLIGRITDPTDV